METSAAATAEDKEEHHLAVGRGKAGAGDDEGEPGRVEHDLQGKEDEDRVPAHEHAREAEEEEDTREHHAVLEGNLRAHLRPPASCDAASFPSR